MKHGAVVQFRLSTEDIMSCIDILNDANISKDGMSLGMVCKLVLSSYLETCRKSNSIPTRDGFEYLNMITPFVNVSQVKKANMISNMPRVDTVQTRIMSPSQEPTHHMKRAEDEFKTHDADMIRKRASVELAVDELTQREIIEGENFSREQHNKLVALNAALIQLNNDIDVDVHALLE